MKGVSKMNFYIGSVFKNIELVNYFSKKLQEKNWNHTYNWALNINDDESKEDMIEYSKLEIDGIKKSDITIIILPAGRGTHIELGIALALNKKIYLCSENEDDFSLLNTVNFYELPYIKKLSGNKDEIIQEILKDNEI